MIDVQFDGRSFYTRLASGKHANLGCVFKDSYDGKHRITFTYNPVTKAGKWYDSLTLDLSFDSPEEAAEHFIKHYPAVLGLFKGNNLDEKGPVLYYVKTECV